MGALFSAFMWMTLIKNVGYVKKIPIALTFIHLGGLLVFLGFGLRNI